VRRDEWQVGRVNVAKRGSKRKQNSSKHSRVPVKIKIMALPAALLLAA